MQLVSVTFARKIYKAADPTALIESGDTVSVRLRTGCYSCQADPTTPNVPNTALGTDSLATLEDNSDYVLSNQEPYKCVGEIVSLTVEDVINEGRGFTYDRAAANQDYRSEDIEMVMPDHDGTPCDEAASSAAPE